MLIVGVTSHMPLGIDSLEKLAKGIIDKGVICFGASWTLSDSLCNHSERLLVNPRD